MRRLPIYLLLDTSGSMAGEPIEAVKSGLQMLISALRKDPYALETAYLSIISFDSQVRTLLPLTEVVQMQVPALAASGGTSLGEALKVVAQASDRDIARSTMEKKGDWRPLVFLMTDGIPTDDLDAGVAEFRKRSWGIVVACAAGAAADEKSLKRITENVVRLDVADTNTIAAYFKWVSSSISTGSQKADGGGEFTGVNELPPPPPQISLVK